MRDLNQINYLSKIARPSFSVITNIGMSHIETLKTRKNIAKSKAEIYEGMDYNGITILNRDDDFFDYLNSKSKGKVISFGENKNADIVITDIKLNEKAHPSFKINGLPLKMESCVGKHHAYNAAIGFAIATELGITERKIINQISTFKTPEKRGKVTFLKNDALLLDSTYNAAPDSIKASLYTISELSKRGKRTVAVIGDMLELGNHSQEAHSHIGKTIKNMYSGIKLLVTIGDYSKFIGKESQIKNWQHFENSNLAANFLIKEVKNKDVVLLQGSNSVNLNVVVNSLEDKFGAYGKRE